MTWLKSLDTISSSPICKKISALTMGRVFEASANFFCENGHNSGTNSEKLFPRWEMNRLSEGYKGPLTKIGVVWQKLDFWSKNPIFCRSTPISVNGPYVALGVTVHFPPWEQFFDFPFQSYSSFRKKKLVDSSKCLPPPHCGGTVCQ